MCSDGNYYEGSECLECGWFKESDGRNGCEDNVGHIMIILAIVVVVVAGLAVGGVCYYRRRSNAK